jgi:hypothetical protein
VEATRSLYEAAVARIGWLCLGGMGAAQETVLYFPWQPPALDKAA